MGTAWNKIVAHQESLKLPLGHYDIKRTKLELEKEYAKSAEVERQANKHIPPHLRWLNKDQVLDLIWFLCSKSGSKLPKKIFFNSADVIKGSAGHYNSWTKEIHFCKNFNETISISLTTVVHEVTHSVGYMGHDEVFCEMETLLFEIVKEWYNRWPKELT